MQTAKCITKNNFRVTSTGKLYQELDLERWYKKLCLFYKVFKNEHPQYFCHLIPVRHSSHTSRNAHIISILSIKHFFFLSTISECNKLAPSIRYCENLSIFRKKYSAFPKTSSQFYL